MEFTAKLGGSFVATNYFSLEEAFLCTIRKLGAAAADMNGFAWRACRRAYFRAYADFTDVFTFIELLITNDVHMII